MFSKWKIIQLKKEITKTVLSNLKTSKYLTDKKIVKTIFVKK